VTLVWVGGGMSRLRHEGHGGSLTLGFQLACGLENIVVSR